MQYQYRNQDEVTLYNYFGGCGSVFISFLKNVLKQAGVEATEEACTEVANIIADSIVMGDLSEYRDMSFDELARQVALYPSN